MYPEVNSISLLSNASLHLDFMEQLNLLGKPSKQKAYVESSPETKMKVELTLLSSIITKSSMETGKNNLDVFSNAIYTVLKAIYDSEDIISSLNEYLALFSPDSRKKVLSASRQSVENNLMKETKENQDRILQECYKDCIKELDKVHARSREAVLSIDTTPEETRSKYLNDQYSYVHKGQNNTWKRGFTYSSTFDSTHQQFISFRHINYHMVSKENTGSDAFIKQIETSCRIMEERGIHVKIIEGDRGYYRAELFAASYLCKLNTKCNHKSHSSVVVPRKFTRDKEFKKIEFLDNPNSKIVEIEYMKLPKNSQSFLIPLCKRKGVEFDSANYLIPVYNVAIADGYSTNKHRTIDELKREWKINEEKLQKTKLRIKNFQNEYASLQKQAGIKNIKKLTKITQKIRTKFRNDAIKHKYLQLRKTLEYHEKLKKKRRTMLNSLMFFTVSMSINEEIDHSDSDLIKLVWAYHERWGIENGFKDDKQKFIRKVSTRKSTGRQWNLLTGMMLYNRWHVARLKAILKIERKRYWNRVSWEPKMPYIRRKFERKYSAILSAESYLLQLFEYGIKERLKQIINL